MVKTTTLKRLLQDHCTDLADILQEVYGAPPYIKELISFRLDRKQTFRGWSKIWKKDIKFQTHGPFELGSQFFGVGIEDNALTTFRKV